MATITPNRTFPSEGEQRDEATVGAHGAELGPPGWIEVGAGFPPDSLGTQPAPYGDNVVSTDQGDFTGSHARDVIAFTEFLAGSAFDDGERDWLIDAIGREFLNDPAVALGEIEQVSNAVEALAALDPVERANNRYTTLTAMYQSEPQREEAGAAESPMMTSLKAHNPALMIDESGVVVVADCIYYRQQINGLILALADRKLDELTHIRAGLSEQYQDAPILMKTELSGSQVRLVLLRSWLAELPQPEIVQLRARLGAVIDATTNLDLVALQLSFRSMIESVEADDLI